MLRAGPRSKALLSVKTVVTKSTGREDSGKETSTCDFLLFLGEYAVVVGGDCGGGSIGEAVRRLHAIGNGNAEDRGQGLEPAPEDGIGGETDLAQRLILLMEDRMPMVDRMELARKIDGVARQERELERLGGALHGLFDLRDREHEVPEIVAPERSR